MKNSTLRFALAVFLIVPSADGWAQSDLPPNSGPAYLAEWTKREAAVKGKAGALDAAIAAEEKAGRLKPEAARQLREKLAKLNFEALQEKQNGRIGFLNAADGSDETDNEAVKKAWSARNEALRERDAYEARNSLAAQADLQKSALALWARALASKDLEPALDAAKSARAIAAAAGRNSSEPELIRRMIERSEDFLIALESGDSAALRRASVTYEDQIMEASRIIGPGRTEKWQRRFQTSLIGELKAVQQEFMEKIVSRAASADISSVAAKADSTASRLEAVLGRQFSGSQPYAPGLSGNFMRSWARVLADAETGRWAAAKQEAGQLNQQGLQELDVEAAATIAARIEEMKEQLAAAKRAALAAAEKRVLERLGEVTDAAKALGLASELAAARGAKNSPEATDEAVYENDLRHVAAIWSGAGFSGGGSIDGVGLRASGSAAWNKAIFDLRERAAREALARLAPAPELLQPPLDALGAGAAVRQLGRELFAKQDWTRLHALLSHAGADLSLNRENEEARGIRAFITGRHFEQAEQFAGAAEAYREVLVCLGDLVPVDAAAARLKALRVEHPEVFPKLVRGGDKVTR